MFQVRKYVPRIMFSLFYFYLKIYLSFIHIEVHQIKFTVNTIKAENIWLKRTQKVIKCQFFGFLYPLSQMMFVDSRYTA